MEMTKEDYALAKQIPDMLRGFTIMTNYGDIYISEEEAKPFVIILEKMTEKKLKSNARSGSQARSFTTST